MLSDAKNNLWQTLDSWSRNHGVNPAPETDAFKLSWNGDTRYIDVFPDPTRDIVVVQYGTIDQRTHDANPCGVTRWGVHDLETNLTELKQTVDQLPAAAPEQPRRQYTPSIDIGVVKSLKFR